MILRRVPKLYVDLKKHIIAKSDDLLAFGKANNK